MMNNLEKYAAVAGDGIVDHLQQLAEHLKGLSVVHVNSTRVGGGVAEILAKLIPLMCELGLNASWEVISGEPSFYECTKGFHNALQGSHIDIPRELIKCYEETNRENYKKLKTVLETADIVFIHDPQPVPLLKLCPNRKGKWVWRCHIDISRPYRSVWRYLRNYVVGYDASIFSLASFARQLPHPQYLIPPSIDPLSEKNMELKQSEIREVYDRFNIDPERPVITQVSRFDIFKDPLGVIKAFKLAKKFIPMLQLVLAGGSATDDPEGEMVLNEVHKSASGDPDIHVLLLPSDSHKTINALQRISHIVLQKSIKEGFGLTVTEAMWKGKPVIGGDTGGIRIQVLNHHTGFRVNSSEGAALRIRYLLYHQDKLIEMGEKAKRFVKENFLLTRHLREYLILMVSLVHGDQDRLELG